MPTPTRLLADHLIPGGVDQFIATRRQGDKPMSWRKISLDLMAHTAGQVNVTPETIRLWSQSTEDAA
jgi:hypothetical protein